MPVIDWVSVKQGGIDRQARIQTYAPPNDQYGNFSENSVQYY